MIFFSSVQCGSDANYLIFHGSPLNDSPHCVSHYADDLPGLIIQPEHWKTKSVSNISESSFVELIGTDAA